MTTRMTVMPPGRGSHDNDSVSEDITDLTFLQAKSVRNVGLVLQKRLATNSCFTRIGARVLVAVNPYVGIDVDLESYVQSLATPDDQLAPHIYQLAAVVYFHLRRSGIDQSVVFSGDTGSGKSYCLNLFLKFMAAARSKSNKETRLFNNIENIELVFRSFATAATAYHSDASRVGRYMELQFDARGRTIGVKYLDYLLEKDRVTNVVPGESNFHVFYQMLAGVSAEERSHFRLQDAAHYHFLSGTASPHAPVDLEAQFIALKASLKTLGFNRKSQSQIFQLLASILHLGNIAFVNQGQHNTSEPAVIKNPEVLDLAADFLGLLPSTLEGLLTYKSVLIKREMCTVFLNASDAAIQRDDLAKCLYSLLFAWLMEHINSRLCKEAQSNFIGLLDLPGFQSKSSPDSFDSFLVNYANERLFNYLCFQVFEASNNAYEEDGVLIPLVDYVGNQNSVHLLGKPGSGIVSIIDKQANRAKGPASDAALMQALARSHGQDPLLQLDRSNSLFTVQHFAKSVTYSVSGFMESNRAAIGPDFVFTFRGGDDMPVGNPFVAGLFTSDAVATESHPKNAGAIVSAQQPSIPLRQPSMKRARVKTGDGTKTEKPPGAAVQFQMGMDELFDTFDNTEAWFVVCLNANPTRAPRRADIDTLTAQVERYALHSMATRKEVEYTVCYQHDEFVTRYSHVLEAAGIDTGLMPAEVLQATKTQFGWEPEHMAVGNRFTYLCDGVWRDLEENLSNAERDGFQPAYFGEDTRSFYSDEDYFDRESKISGSQDGDIHLTKAENQLLLDSPDEDSDDNLPKTSTRKSWICFTWCMTWWIPSSFLSCCAGMKLKEVRMAWREKVTLCILIFLMCSSVVLFIVGINPLICPTRQIFSSYEISSFNTPSKPLVSVNGQVFDLRGLTTHYGTQQAQLTKVYAGNDVSYLFPMQLSSLCQRYDGTAIDETVSLSNTTMGAQDKNAQYHDHRYYRGADYYQPDWYQNAMQRMRLTMKAGDLAVDPTTLAKKAASNYFWVLLNNRVYDLNNYVIGNVYTLTPPTVSAPTTPGYNFMDPNFIDLVRAGSGKDITLAFNKLYAGDSATKAITTQCLNNAFYAGVLDDRQSFRCVFAQYILLALSVFLFAILFVKFLASLQLGSRPEPEDHDKFVICNVPCYTEGEDSLKKTIDSLAVLKYDDKRKLLFIIADGMVMGGGNDQPTPRIVLDIVGADPTVDPEPLSFLSLGDGMKQHNMAKVYTGLYECMGHVVPYLVVVKVGKPSERAKPGNRGKRDSQMILMRFFNKVHYDYPMVPLELEMYHQIKNVIGVDPHFYEFVLMVDADTVVMPDSLNRLVSAMLHDTKIMGLCGETALANEKDTWATMIQVYEYFISHHLAKAFESLFGSVTCLPGCFCMYRLRAVNNQPLLVNNSVIHDYSENRVDTLHKKNLLHLGEDRYLTTLMLKHFPFFKMTFTPDAKCLTNAPDTWDVLLSQRRRWINSTVHNLLELVFLPRLCGFCCFSMRFVVFMDLLSTVIMPATLGYLGYLVYRLATDSSSVPVLSLCFIIAPYALQMIVFILWRQWQHIGWMIVYLLALPVFAFFIPLYAFWHFDDFSWGNTRVVVGEDGRRKKVLVGANADDGKFDAKAIPTKKWSEYEEELWEAHTEYSQDSRPFRLQQTSGSQIHTPQEPFYAVNNQRSSSHLLATSPSQNFPRPDSRSNVNLPETGYGSRTNLTPPPPISHQRALSPLTMNRPPSQSRTYSPDLEAEIANAVRQILSTNDLMSITKKQVRDQVALLLNRDMAPYRDLISRCIESQITSQQ